MLAHDEAVQGIPDSPQKGMESGSTGHRNRSEYCAAACGIHKLKSGFESERRSSW